MADRGLSSCRSGGRASASRRLPECGADLNGTGAQSCEHAEARVDSVDVAQIPLLRFAVDLFYNTRRKPSRVRNESEACRQQNHSFLTCQHVVHLVVRLVHKKVHVVEFGQI